MNDSVKVTLKSYNEPSTIRVMECVERFQLDSHRVKITCNIRSSDSNCDIIVIEGAKDSLLKLAKYIEAVERLAKDWVVPTLEE